MNKDLSVWFLNLDIERLARMFPWPDDMNAYEFMDACDDYWWGLSDEEKEEFYREHR